MVHGHVSEEAESLGSFLLDVGSALLASGASCARIVVTVKRFAVTYNFAAQVSIMPRTISIAIHQGSEKKAMFSSIRNITHHTNNFKVIAGISKLSWDAIEKKLSINDCKEALTKILSLPHYPQFVVLSLVSLAGGAFSFSFGGSYVELLITFLATFVGLFIRQEAAKRKFNNYICVFLGAFVASFVSGAFLKFGNNISADHAFVTAVLYLMPGVPLINSITDLIDGYILNGAVRGVNALILICAIALGMLVSMFIYNI